jgi:hypothetical protein
MGPGLQRFLTRSRMRLLSIARMFGSLFQSVKPRIKDFGSLTMCPSCGLITSKNKTCCLECGKSLKAF